MMGAPILFAALLLQVLPAPDSLAWEPAGTDRAGRNAIAPASISRSGDVVRFKLRVLYHDPARHRGVSVSISEILIDCRRQTFGIKAADGYGADGRLLYSREAQPAEIAYMPLTTIEHFERVRDRVCGEALA